MLYVPVQATRTQHLATAPSSPAIPRAKNGHFERRETGRRRRLRISLTSVDAGSWRQRPFPKTVQERSHRHENFPFCARDARTAEPVALKCDTEVC